MNEIARYFSSFFDPILIDFTNEGKILVFDHNFFYYTNVRKQSHFKLKFFYVNNHFSSLNSHMNNL